MKRIIKICLFIAIVVIVIVSTLFYTNPKIIKTSHCAWEGGVDNYEKIPNKDHTDWMYNIYYHNYVFKFYSHNIVNLQIGHHYRFWLFDDGFLDYFEEM